MCALRPEMAGMDPESWGSVCLELLWSHSVEEHPRGMGLELQRAPASQAQRPLYGQGCL